MPRRRRRLPDQRCRLALVPKLALVSPTTVIAAPLGSALRPLAVVGKAVCYFDGCRHWQGAHCVPPGGHEATAGAVGAPGIPLSLD